MSKDVANNMLYWLALVIGMLGIIGHFVTIPVITAYAFWLVVTGFVLFMILPILDDTMHA